ncbi:four helix bundle protein [Patescibacteria group bacterium]
MKRKPNIYYRAFDFAIKLINEMKELSFHPAQIEICRQVNRSSMSISANIIEAQNARSRIEFISCNKIALKEAEETFHWIRMLKELRNGKTDYFTKLEQENREIIKIIASIIISAQRNLEKEKSLNNQRRK